MGSSVAADAAPARAARRWRGPPLPPVALAVGLVAVPFVGSDFVAYQIALFLIYGIATQGVALCSRRRRR